MAGWKSKLRYAEKGAASFVEVTEEIAQAGAGIQRVGEPGRLRTEVVEVGRAEQEHVAWARVPPRALGRVQAEAARGDAREVVVR